MPDIDVSKIGRSRRLFNSHEKLLMANAGGPNSDLAHFLAGVARESIVSFHDNFDGVASAALDATHWVSTADASGTAFAVPATALAGGGIVGLTSATDNNAVTLNGPLIFKGDNHCLFYARIKLSGITNTPWFGMGFTTTPSDLTLPAVLDIDTPTFNTGCTDVAVIHMDVDQTLATMAFATVGSTSGYDARKTALGTRAFVADTFLSFLVGLDGDNAYARVFDADGNLIEEASHGGSNAIEGGSLVMPYIFHGVRAATDRTMTIQYAGWLANRRS